MQPADIIVVVIIALIVGAAMAYIIKAKRSGKGCIGCPDSCSCNASAKSQTTEDTGACASCGSCCGCHKEDSKMSSNQ